MERWHLTLGLGVAAVLAAFIAPRLASTPGVAPTPPPDPVTTPEPSPKTGSLELRAALDQAAVLVGSDEERFLTLTITAPPEAGERGRRPLNLSVVLDASGSMGVHGKMEQARQAARRLASAMEPDDLFSVVRFADHAVTVRQASPVLDLPGVHRLIDGVRPRGGTNLHAGMMQGAVELRRSGSGDHVSRMLVLSDGNANTGVTDPAALARHAATLAAEGFTISTVGLGLDYDDEVLARIADHGGGSYAFVNDPPQLEQVFQAELDRFTAVVAREAHLTVSLPDGVEGLEVLGWEAERAAEGWSIRIGDVHAGERRKVVMRVRVHAPAEGEVPVAEARLAYHDLGLGQPAIAVADQRAQATTDRARVAGSVQREAAVEALHAWGQEYLDRSTRAYAAGDRDSARALLVEGQALLQDAAARHRSEALAAQAEELQRVERGFEAAPASPEGQVLIRENKVRYRSGVRTVLTP